MKANMNEWLNDWKNEWMEEKKRQQRGWKRKWKRQRKREEPPAPFDTWDNAALKNTRFLDDGYEDPSNSRMNTQYMKTYTIKSQLPCLSCPSPSSRGRKEELGNNLLAFPSPPKNYPTDVHGWFVGHAHSSMKPNQIKSNQINQIVKMKPLIICFTIRSFKRKKKDADTVT